MHFGVRIVIVVVMAVSLTATVVDAFFVTLPSSAVQVALTAKAPALS